MRAQIEERNIAVYLLLTIFTCGIFGIYWLVVIIKDVSAASGEDMEPWMTILLIILTCGLYGWYCSYKIGKNMHIAGQRYNVNIEDNALLYLLLSIFKLDLVNYCLIQNDLNTLAKSNPSVVVGPKAEEKVVEDYDDNNGPIKQ